VKPHSAAAQAAAPLMMKKRASLAYQSECAQVQVSGSAASAAVPESVECVSVQDAAAGLLFLVTSSEPQPPAESQPAAERMASETYSLAVSPVGSADGPWGGSSVQWTRPCSPAASPALLPVAAAAASATHMDPACAESKAFSRMPSPRDVEEVPHSHLSLVGRNVMMPIPSEWAPAPRVPLMPAPAATFTLASLGVPSVGASAPIELAHEKEATVSTAASAVAEAALAIAAATRATSTSSASAKPTARRGRPPSQPRSQSAAAASATSWDPRWVSVPLAGTSTLAAPALATSTVAAAPAAPSFPEQQLVLANAHEALAKAAHAAQAAHTQAYAQAAYAQAMAQAAQAQAHAQAQASHHAQAQPPAPPASSDRPAPSVAPVQVQAQAQVQQVPIPLAIPAVAPTHAPAHVATHAPAHVAQA